MKILPSYSHLISKECIGFPKCWKIRYIFCSVIFCGRLDWFWIFGRVFFSSQSIGPDKSRGFSQILAIFTAIYFSFLKHSATRVKLLINSANHASVLESMWRWFVFLRSFFYVFSFQSNLIILNIILVSVSDLTNFKFLIGILRFWLQDLGGNRQVIFNVKHSRA